MKTTLTRRVMALTIALAGLAIAAPIAQAGNPPGHKIRHARSVGTTVNTAFAATVKTVPAQTQAAVVDSGNDAQTCGDE